VPISGLNGDNLIERSTNPDLTSWYKGECLVEILDRLRVPKRALDKPLRLTVLEY
jgi:elongation factor 1 alpha-like protein